jgi:hypothetical protein
MCSLPPSPTFQERWVQHQGDVGVAESGVATPHSEPSVHQAANVINSVADSDPGSGAYLTHGSWISDFGSKTYIFESFVSFE